MDNDERGQSWECVGSYAALIVERLLHARNWRERCESPIEIILAVEMEKTLVPLLKKTGFELVPQYNWLSFRIDFAIVFESIPALFIECDGKEFHSTEEQIQRDNRKNLAANRAGIPLLRFSGSSIYRDAEKCVSEVLRTLSRQ